MPQNVVRGKHGADVANGRATLDFPLGTMIDEKTAEITLPRGTAVGFKQKAKGKGNNNGRGNGNNNGQNKMGKYSGSGRDRNLAVTTKTVLVVRILANGGSTTDTEARLSDSVFGNGNDPVSLKSQYNDCSYGQMNFVKAANRGGTGANISNGTYTFTCTMISDAICNSLFY